MTESHDNIHVLGMKFHLFPVFVTLFSIAVPLYGLRISGRVTGFHFGTNPRWRVHSEFLGKFGVRRGKPMYVYGSSERRWNHTRSVDPLSKMLLVVSPRSKWEDFVKISERSSRNELTTYACNHSLLKPFGEKCQSYSPYYREFPCDDRYCRYQTSERVPNNSQFLYKISPGDTEYYYIFFIYCGRNFSNPSCDWESSTNVNFTYEISITTDPFNSHNPFTFQFPANLEGLLISYLFFSLLYALLVPGHIISHFKCCGAKHRRTHLLVWLFSAALVLEAVSMLCGLINFSVYSADGGGVAAIFYIKDFVNLLGNWCLILVLILVAGGWRVTVKSIKWKFASFPIWLVYIASSVLYYIWEVVRCCCGMYM